MMLVPTRLAPSAIDGLGIFTTRDVKKGEPIWKFQAGLDHKILKSEIAKLPEHVREYIDLYGHDYTEDRDYTFIDFDNGRYMNHSDEPNTDFSVPYIGTAARDIAAGEELTCDYREFQRELFLFEANKNFGA